MISVLNESRYYRVSQKQLTFCCMITISKGRFFVHPVLIITGKNVEKKSLPIPLTTPSVFLCPLFKPKGCAKASSSGVYHHVSYIIIHVKRLASIEVR